MGAQQSAPAARFRADADLPAVPLHHCFQPLADGIPSYIGAPPAIGWEHLSGVRALTKEGFQLLQQTFPDSSGTELRAFLVDGENSSPGYLLTQAVHDYAARPQYRATQGGQRTSEDLLQQLGASKLPSALQYLCTLAAAAVADGMFRPPGPSLLGAPATRAEGAAVEAPSIASADVSVSESAANVGKPTDPEDLEQPASAGGFQTSSGADPAPRQPKLNPLRATTTSAGSAVMEDRVVSSSSSSGSSSSGADNVAVCELCGDLPGEGVMCSCSHGHAVCRICLRQFVLYTHGLQAGLQSLRCLAFAEDDDLPAQSALPPPPGAPAASWRCAGTYSATDLEQCLSPSEVLQLRGGDLLRAARAARPPAVPFGCTACGHKEGLAVQEVQAALARSQPRRRRRRALSCGFRSQWAAEGPPPIECPAVCGAKYCVRCGCPDHPGRMCSFQPQDPKLVEWCRKRKTAVQRCPRCFIVIEKHGGCRYMLCPPAVGGCGHEFCWACREPYLGMHRCGRQPRDYEDD